MCLSLLGATLPSLPCTGAIEAPSPQLSIVCMDAQHGSSISLGHSVQDAELATIIIAATAHDGMLRLADTYATAVYQPGTARQDSHIAEQEHKKLTITSSKPARAKIHTDRPGADGTAARTTAAFASHLRHAASFTGHDCAGFLLWLLGQYKFHQSHKSRGDKWCPCLGHCKARELRWRSLLTGILLHSIRQPRPVCTGTLSSPQTQPPARLQPAPGGAHILGPQASHPGQAVGGGAGPVAAGAHAGLHVQQQQGVVAGACHQPGVVEGQGPGHVRQLPHLDHRRVLRGPAATAESAAVPCEQAVVGAGAVPRTLGAAPAPVVPVPGCSSLSMSHGTAAVDGMQTLGYWPRPACSDGMWPVRT